MGVFHISKIVEMVLNRAKHLISWQESFFLTHCMPLVSFYTSWEYQQIRGMKETSGMKSIKKTKLRCPNHSKSLDILLHLYHDTKFNLDLDSIRFFT